MNKMKTSFKGGLCGSDIVNDRIKLITEGEIGISQQILECGYSICCIAFETFAYKKGEPWSLPMGDLRQIKEWNRFANRI